MKNNKKLLKNSKLSAKISNISIFLLTMIRENDILYLSL